MQSSEQFTTLPVEDFDAVMFQNAFGVNCSDENSNPNLLFEVQAESSLTVTDNALCLIDVSLLNPLLSVQAPDEETFEDDFNGIDSVSLLFLSETATASSTEDKENESQKTSPMVNQVSRI